MVDRQAAISSVKVCGGYVGTYEAPDGRKAVVTGTSSDQLEARMAADVWVVEAMLEDLLGRKGRYFWSPHPSLEGFFEVIRDGLTPTRVPLVEPLVN